MSLVGHLFAACPVWSEAFSTNVPVLSELQQDALVLGKAASNAIRVPLSETMREEAADLGYVTADSTEFVVPANWDTAWNEDQKGHAARAVREHLADTQTRLLRRLWDAHAPSATLPAINERGSSVWMEAWDGSGAGGAGSGASGSASTTEDMSTGTRVDASGSASTTEGTGTGGTSSGGVGSSETGARVGGGTSTGGSGGGGEADERLLTLQLLQQSIQALTLQAAGGAVNATNANTATRSVVEHAEEARFRRRSLLVELAA